MKDYIFFFFLLLLCNDETFVRSEMCIKNLNIVILIAYADFI